MSFRMCKYVCGLRFQNNCWARAEGGAVYAFAMLIYSAKFLFKEALLIYIPASIVYAYMFCPGLTYRVCS